MKTQFDNVLGLVSAEEIRLLMFLSQDEADELERTIIARNKVALTQA